MTPETKMSPGPMARERKHETRRGKDILLILQKGLLTCSDIVTGQPCTALVSKVDAIMRRGPCRREIMREEM
jgi:hypothetical protein